MKPLKVEMVGVPGAGKSTLAEAVCDLAKAEGVATLQRDAHRARLAAWYLAQPMWRRRASVLLALGRERRAMWSTTRLATRLRPRLAVGYWRSYLLLRLLQNDRAFERLRTGDEALLVLDQDILQELWSVLYLRSCPEQAWLEEVLDTIRGHLPDVVICPRLDGASAKARIAARVAAVGVHGDIDAMHDLDPEVLDRMDREAARIGRLAADRSAGVYVEVDATRAPSALAEEVWDAVRARLGVRGRPR